VQALLDLACTVAPDDISTAAIAQRMGLSHAALFRHFPSREALWAEAVHWATAELTQMLQGLVQNSLEGLIERAGLAHSLLLADLSQGRSGVFHAGDAVLRAAVGGRRTAIGRGRLERNDGLGTQVDGGHGPDK
jgi:AcrR family transcriptional regulator